jgi:flagellar FliJ protein
METPFHFGLERVRNVRVHAEEQAKEQFAASLSQQLRGAAMLRAAEAHLEDARTNAVPAASSAPLTGGDLAARQAWVERLERTRAAAMHTLRALDDELVNHRSSLTQASLNRETLERLRDRQRRAHVPAGERRAGNAMDEMAIRRHARRSHA